ncbi:glycolate oxidase FAD binding subunit [Actinoplanes sp. SE50]|uniref:FAD-binding oxidoreductase n=1 Tax=unclassified Actinoplanes TaxID=2626549 RepID=UPI00023EC006|nr:MULTISPECIES: FAD-binding oxidoreductase [unclassified Actinoplanes]AEV81291.1 glycolate oxidase FAD binding subunit [Actinoplanes sp. SE50/110]ATO79694.1 glycolate oxidase FAD binding subunit [Actinoplanes sp. SE50]SLL97097.1 glycolate oxidase [Actinoplanes sp. SE50/110]
MTDSLLDALVDICGPGFARPARSVDRVGGQRAGHVAVPATGRAAGAALRLAAERGLSVRARGSGSKIDWGTPPAGLDLIIDTGRLNGMWDHHGATATVAAGTSLAAVRVALALQGKRLAVDPPSPGATVGGMLAVNEAGPLAHRYGSPADQTLSVMYAEADGAELETDGENGRPGIANIRGVITAAVLRLHPLPETRRWVGRSVTTPAGVAELVEQAVEQDLEPSAIEVDLPGAAEGTVAVLIEGDTGSVAGRAAKLGQVWGPEAAVVEHGPPWWGRYPFGAGDVAVRISVPPEGLQAVTYALRDACGVPVPLRGSAGLGTVHAVLPAGLPARRLAEIVDGVDQVLMARSGKIVVVSAPPALAVALPMATPRDLF